MSAQQETFEFLLQYLIDNHHSASVKDIAKHFNISYNAARGRLSTLERNGLIVKSAGQARSYGFTGIELEARQKHDKATTEPC